MARCMPFRAIFFDVFFTVSISYLSLAYPILMNFELCCLPKVLYLVKSYGIWILVVADGVETMYIPGSSVR